MLNRRSVRIPDVYQDRRVPHDAYRDTFVKSLAMVPIRMIDPVGAIGVFWADEHMATDREMALALTHHERWDGHGYPSGLAGEQIPMSGRIVALADVFDALTHARPYKPAWAVEQAMAEIRRLSGSQFDPGVVDAFLAIGGERLAELPSWWSQADAARTSIPASIEGFAGA
jgi:hypothetical protein